MNAVFAFFLENFYFFREMMGFEGGKVDKKCLQADYRFPYRFFHNVPIA